MSIGAAVFPHDGRTYEDLLSVADNRMYRDKSRRKTGSHTQPPSQRQTLPFRDDQEQAGEARQAVLGGLS
jgi:predicted signal transduction protein with EAL and GGDEF domain